MSSDSALGVLTHTLYLLKTSPDSWLRQPLLLLTENKGQKVETGVALPLEPVSSHSMPAAVDSARAIEQALIKHRGAPPP